MSIELKEIDVKDYDQERALLQELVNKIWTRPESAENAWESINHWGEDKKESGSYFFIMQGTQPIGLTGYYISRPEHKELGLRHHGTTVKGTGKQALELLLDIIRTRHPDFKTLIEQIPKGREDLFLIYESWGFKHIESDQEWERKKDYYAYVMVRPI